ncbi:hypothetical protein WICANDRAFT_64317 [Wickerhamomyces anomalus NRRL Y-366-8]|uniref:Ribosome biogenesis protein ERB1 n=1 Tax=Wickerhamomyces anomalus (strain ATCC 58044 / CBS 1984 / NCYC 433 / NRRL Y-366-8) TaxID=683960 RepID=A0A1E3NYH6_WICAA|nr:uncharacterized protein WICANDRAFT_64317 [Wickerhamomyces anomalus NRRL Y-366-8]ODQ58173.1 hypothetical protein WICANDRAFT_64317 [Wickerhamomyces anomalus NRRL Y-366-8]
MAKKGSLKRAPVVEAPRKRKIEEESEESVEESEDEELNQDDEINVNGLIDDEASEDEEEYSEEEEEEDSEDDSDAEFNTMLGDEPENISDLESLEFEDEPKDNTSISDKLSNVHIRSLSDASDKQTTYIDGTPRVIKPEIEPVYESDDSDVENFNTIGNIPISAYEEMPHIGYDINGKRIMRPARGSALEQLLESIDLPEGWTGLLDSNTGGNLNLTKEEIELIRKLEINQSTDDSINPYEPTIEWFTSKQEIMPLTATPEPKRRFIPSKHEAKRVMKIVRAIREGRIVPNKPAVDEEEEHNYDLWGDGAQDNVDHIMTLRAPKMAPPTNEESYNPPEEYLLNDEEIAKFNEMEPSERERNFIPKKYGSLRKVPGYEENIRERFERSLDLYLAPRVRHNKLNIDPESLIPELPSPKDLRPFPIRCSTSYVGHKGKIRTLSIDPSGLWLATGSDDGTVKIWEVLTGREVYSIRVVGKDNDEDHVESVEWNPDQSTGILAISAGEHIYLVSPPIFGFDIENTGRLKLESGFGFNKFGNVKKNDLNVNEDSDLEEEAVSNKKEYARWIKPSEEMIAQGVVLTVECRKTVKSISWHRKGDYFVSVSPDSGNSSVLIHQISKHSSQSPFKKSKGIIMDVKFHPFKPQIFVCSQRYVRVYDLAQQVLIKKLLPGARWLSKIDIHPRGDHLLASSFDKRVLWHDLDLQTTPYKTLRYHEKAVRSIKYHKGGLPLFASASDDGNIHVFHGTVYDDLMTNPLLVPLKKLSGHKVINSLGVLDIVWHPKEAWLFSSGADGVARLWTT